MTRSVVSSLQRALSAAAVFAVATTQAAIIITPVYDASFTGAGNFAALQDTVNNALAIYASNVSNNLTFAINFKFDPLISGAQSSYRTNDFSYVAYRAALVTHATTTNDAIVLAGLSAGVNDPVVNGANVSVTEALGVALGLRGSLANYGTVSFEKARYETNPMGFLGVIQHEVNEVLGTSSSLPNANPPGTAGTLPTTITPADLFRFGTDGTRNFTVNAANDPANKAFFRLSSGSANQQEFNNLPNGGDYSDWHTGADRLFAPAPQDQSGDETIFTSMSISPAELILLDAIGYSAFPVPEPGTSVLFCTALGWLALRRSRRKVGAARS